jgi:hypothetical protein
MNDEKHDDVTEAEPPADHADPPGDHELEPVALPPPTSGDAFQIIGDRPGRAAFVDMLRAHAADAALRAHAEKISIGEAETAVREPEPDAHPPEPSQGELAHAMPEAETPPADRMVELMRRDSHAAGHDDCRTAVLSLLEIYDAQVCGGRQVTLRELRELKAAISNLRPLTRNLR